MKITICGSIGFYKEMESARDELIKHRHEVKIPELALEVPQEFGGGGVIHSSSGLISKKVRILYNEYRNNIKNRGIPLFFIFLYGERSSKQ
jgi:hypothetical protein